MTQKILCKTQKILRHVSESYSRKILCKTQKILCKKQNFFKKFFIFGLSQIFENFPL